MNLRPLHERVLVRRNEEETMTAGGIAVPHSAQEKPARGEVLAVGPGKSLDNGTLRAAMLKPGDQVIFGQYSGSTVKVDNEELVILSEDDVLGVVDA